ncbi:phage antirepressor KilAC domain-containing protein [Granulicella tundricola]|uniref:Prophage antirepressor n=1 Tax=Granulicella tundricola (strain ATCC BAA-1859 / DSM 23138 / MP5ACTX9) TaxID=1198114 RepID=E8X2N6_GRATM|nr:phage antirepressor KilAC domain-containing protein [Granulicella tundricola]ADW70333.1 prophage antirepressor [Granulicella tundricola MP5ACTX9]
MDALIEVAERQIGGGVVQSINARDLHAFLGSRADFSTWVKQQIERARLQQNRDYLIHKKVEQLPSGAKSRNEYFLSLDSAKHVGMMSRSERGFQIRDYFLECERRYHADGAGVAAVLQDPAALRTLLLGYSERVVTLEQENSALRPKADFHDAVVEATNCQTVQQVAKVLGTGPNRLFDFLRKHSILMPGNLPHQQHVNAGRFRVVEGHYKDRHGDRQTYTRTLVTGKGLAFIQRRLSESTG